MLDKPIDENIIFTFHFYEPLIFTHQKASWVAGMSPTEDIFYPRSMAYYAEKSIPLGFKGKEVIKFKLDRNTLFGVQFNATCALISQEFVNYNIFHVKFCN